RAMASHVRNIVPNFAVKGVWKERDRWCVSDGKHTRRYDRLAATIPIQELARAVGGVPDAIIEAVDSLRYNTLITVAIGLSTAKLPDFTAIYVPDPEIRFHRLSFPAVFSPHNAPAGQSIIQAEITTNPGDGTHEMSDYELVEDVIADL